MSDDAPVDMRKLLTQHRHTWPFPTTIGTFRLRHLPRIEAQAINAYLSATVPGYEDKMKHLMYLKDVADVEDVKVKAGVEGAGLSPEQMSDMATALAELQPHLDLFVLPCFVEPKVTTVEELDAIANAIEPEEWDNLQRVLGTLSKPSTTSATHASMLLLCKEFNIPLADDLTAENMTLDQSHALETALERQAKALHDIIPDK